VDIHQLAPDEPLSPELVLVLPQELRAQVLAGLGPPVWPTPRPRAVERAAPPPDEPFVRALGEMVLARGAPLVAIFVVVTSLVLVMSLVAQAMR
jgi:hypothetical protein